MDSDPSEIRLLEAIADRAWPPRETVTGVGWEARFADGMSRRVNSATVWPEASDLEAVIEAVEDWYRKRGRRTIFKLTTASASELDGLLAERGYRIDASTLVETKPAVDRSEDDGVSMAAAAGNEWLGTFAGIQGYGPRRRRLLEAQIARISLPAGFALIRSSDRPVAVGLGVHEEDHIGIFELATDPDHRGRGLARRIIERLIGWGAGRGARIGYLQVMENNPAALGLYGRMDFVARYRYWYRVDPHAE